jgi:hypothetical protein
MLNFEHIRGFDLSEKKSIYQICIQGYIKADWAEWLHSFQITQKRNGVTMLTGTVMDQSALQGLLDYLFDLGITLLSLKRLNDSSWLDYFSVVQDKLHHLII